MMIKFVGGMSQADLDREVAEIQRASETPVRGADSFGQRVKASVAAKLQSRHRSTQVNRLLQRRKPTKSG